MKTIKFHDIVVLELKLDARQMGIYQIVRVNLMKKNYLFRDLLLMLAFTHLGLSISTKSL